MGKKIRNGLLAAGGITAAAIAAGSLFTAAEAVNGQKRSLEETKAFQDQFTDTNWYETVSKESYLVESYDGYMLHTERIGEPKSDASGKYRYVIMSHGYNDNKMGNLKYIPIYLRQGFVCIIYDLRGHGENEEAICTFGREEAKDLCVLMRDTRQRYGEDIILGLHGESLGSSVTATALGLRQDVDFAVCDCGFAELLPVVKGRAPKFHLPEFLAYTGSVAARLRYGFYLNHIRPIAELKDNHVPMLFLHGEEDTFIPAEHSLRMQHMTKGYSEIYLIPGAAHARSVLVAPEEYEEHVDHFLLRVLEKKEPRD